MDTLQPQDDMSSDDTTLHSPQDVENEDEAIDYSVFFPNGPKRKHRGRRTIGIIILLIVLAGAGAAGYWKSTQHSSSLQKTSTLATSVKAKTPVAAVIPTTSYSSSNFNLSLNYPQTWKVTADSTSLLTVTSPALQLNDATGQKTTAQVYISILPQGQLSSTFGTSDATAVLPSQLISYSNPTSSQRAQTYLSFVQYASTITIGGLDGVYITGNYGYQKDQDIPRTDVLNLDPIVSVTFGKCADATCSVASGATPLTIAASDWSNSSLSAPILTLLKSLSFQ